MTNDWPGKYLTPFTTLLRTYELTREQSDDQQAIAEAVRRATNNMCGGDLSDVRDTLTGLFDILRPIYADRGEAELHPTKTQQVYDVTVFVGNGDEQHHLVQADGWWEAERIARETLFGDNMPDEAWVDASVRPVDLSSPVRLYQPEEEQEPQGDRW